LIGNPDIEDLMQRIEVVRDEEAEAVYPNFLSRVTIKTKDGRVISAATDTMKGEPNNPMTWDDVEFKFNELCSLSMDEASRRKAIDIVRNLEQVENVRELMQWFRG